jgi:hypothetical protein
LGLTARRRIAPKDRAAGEGANQRAAQPSLDVAARAERGTGGGQEPAVVEVDGKRDVDAEASKSSPVQGIISPIAHDPTSRSALH